VIHGHPSPSGLPAAALMRPLDQVNGRFGWGVLRPLATGQTRE
jgi:hypothetical protein